MGSWGVIGGTVMFCGVMQYTVGYCWVLLGTKATGGYFGKLLGTGGTGE